MVYCVFQTLIDYTWINCIWPLLYLSFLFHKINETVGDTSINCSDPSEVAITFTFLGLKSTIEEYDSALPDSNGSGTDTHHWVNRSITDKDERKFLCDFTREWNVDVDCWKEQWKTELSTNSDFTLAFSIMVILLLWLHFYFVVKL